VVYGTTREHNHLSVKFTLSKYISFGMICTIRKSSNRWKKYGGIKINLWGKKKAIIKIQTS
jgi:hypothetical protein